MAASQGNLISQVKSGNSVEITESSSLPCFLHQRPQLELLARQETYMLQEEKQQLALGKVLIKT